MLPCRETGQWSSNMRDRQAARKTQDRPRLSGRREK